VRSGVTTWLLAQTPQSAAEDRNPSSNHTLWNALIAIGITDRCDENRSLAQRQFRLSPHGIDRKRRPRPWRGQSEEVGQWDRAVPNPQAGVAINERIHHCSRHKTGGNRTAPLREFASSRESRPNGAPPDGS
jgi:hypothetical protein